MHRFEPIDLLGPRINDITDEFAETGKVLIEQAFYAETYVELRRTSRQVLKSKLCPTRQIRDAAWHNVEKVTLFRYPSAKGIIPFLQMTAIHAPEIQRAAHRLDGLAMKLGITLLARGQYDAGDLLTNPPHQSNRAIVNHMCGTPEDPAVIGIHADPARETGVNMVIALDDATDLVTGQLVLANTVSVYACEDVGAALGTGRPEHGFSAEHDRLSIVFTKFG